MEKEIIEYLSRKKAVNKLTAAKSYRIWLERFNDRVGKRLQDLASSDIFDFYEWVKKSKKPKTLEYCAAIIRNFLEENSQQISFNPKIIKINRQRADSHVPVGDTEYHKMLELLPINNYRSLRNHIIVRILHETGCRLSECLSIDLDQITGSPWVSIQTRKTLNERRIFWSLDTHDLIVNKYLPIRREFKTDCSAFFITIYPQNNHATRLTSRAVERMYFEFSKILGTKVVPHGERHGKAHRMLDKGANLADIQVVLGHTNPASSFRYLQYGGIEAEERAKKWL